MYVYSQVGQDIKQNFSAIKLPIICAIPPCIGGFKGELGSYRLPCCGKVLKHALALLNQAHKHAFLYIFQGYTNAKIVTLCEVVLQ